MILVLRIDANESKAYQIKKEQQEEMVWIRALTTNNAKEQQGQHRNATCNYISISKEPEKKQKMISC